MNVGLVNAWCSCGWTVAEVPMEQLYALTGSHPLVCGTASEEHLVSVMAAAEYACDLERVYAEAERMVR